MQFPLINLISAILIIVFAALTGFAQESMRNIQVESGGALEIVNRSGRVAVLAPPENASLSNMLTATAEGGVSDTEIKIASAHGRTTITVAPAERSKRIDITLTVPERISLKIDTAAGAIEVSGNFRSIEARTETGTIATDIPTDDLAYQLSWTESRPRYLADFALSDVKERSRGRFEIKGRFAEESEVINKKEKGALDEANSLSSASEEKPKTVSIKLTTARGIILLNVPTNEVVNDLRQRALTNAAKAIIRSGDSLLMEAIRRASPKHFGDYSRTLPPPISEPRFSTNSGGPVGPAAPLKTALVRVTDLKNRAIPGLGRRDFEVVENGKEREIISVESSTAPFNLVLLLDVSGSVDNYVNFIRKAARNFVETVGKDDRVSIIIFNEDVKLLSTFSTDKAKLSESLDTFDAGGGTAYYDALAFTISETLRPLKGERTAIVVLTDGDDNRSFLPFDSLAGSIQESGALIYPLYVPSGLIALAAQNTGADIDPMRKKYMSLTAKSEGEGERLAKLSGGVYYPITEIRQIQQAYDDIVVQMRSAYGITFRSDTEILPNGVSPRLRIKAKPENTFTTVTAVVAAGGGK
jgi:VWFA-related protein